MEEKSGVGLWHRHLKLDLGEVDDEYAFQEGEKLSQETNLELPYIFLGTNAESGNSHFYYETIDSSYVVLDILHLDNDFFGLEQSVIAHEFTHALIARNNSYLYEASKSKQTPELARQLVLHTTMYQEMVCTYVGYTASTKDQTKRDDGKVSEKLNQVLQELNSAEAGASQSVDQYEEIGTVLGGYLAMASQALDKRALILMNPQEFSDTVVLVCRQLEETMSSKHLQPEEFSNALAERIMALDSYQENKLPEQFKLDPPGEGQSLLKRSLAFIRRSRLNSS